jgi:2-dehydro-3-deoxyglucarate aldolase/4-hydroxy-2-oxoheptanedioate aldolase
VVSDFVIVVRLREKLRPLIRGGRLTHVDFSTNGASFARRLIVTSFKERVRDGDVTLGTFLNLGSALVAEVCALSGFDWLLVDLEHGAGGEEGLVGQLLAGAAHNVPVLVRVESAERIRVGHALDLGVAGVMYPRLNTPDELSTAISHLWYPPRGDRGVASYNRARRFGGDTRSIDDVNDELLCVVQIETSLALSNVKEFAATPGVDVLFVGPGDLSTALGCPGQLHSEVYLEALDHVVATARDAHVGAGILVGDVDDVQAHLDRGFSFVAVASDSALLRRAAMTAARSGSRRN